MNLQEKLEKEVFSYLEKRMTDMIHKNWHQLEKEAVRKYMSFVQVYSKQIEKDGVLEFSLNVKLKGAESDKDA